MVATGVIDVSQNFSLDKYRYMMFVIQEDRLRSSTAEIKAAMDKITDISNRNVIQDGRDCDRLQYFTHALRIYEAEFSVQLKEWKRVSQIVEVFISTIYLELPYWRCHGLISIGNGQFRPLGSENIWGNSRHFGPFSRSFPFSKESHTVVMGVVAW